MKNYRQIACLIAPALLVAGYFAVPTTAKATEPQESAQIAKLLADAKSEAVELKRDSSELDSLTRSKASWKSFASKLNMIKEHINNTGKLLADLKDAEAGGSPWQRTAIKQIEPLLRELAGNTEVTINHLNEGSAKIHFPPFRDYVRANYEMAADLEALIRDFVDYGETKQKFESLGAQLEVGG